MRVRRISIVGAESTGKTTLVHGLAETYRTVFVSEFARTYLTGFGQLRLPEFMVPIANGQIESENGIAPQANQVLICDGCPLSTVIWSNHYFGYCDNSVLELVDSHLYDLYVVTGTDCPWVSDGLRNSEEHREELHQRFVKELELRNFPFLVVCGSPEERLSLASAHINRLLAKDAEPWH